MTLSEIDRTLLERCLQDKPRAWEHFVDRFMGLVVHVVNHASAARNIPLTADDRDDLCAEVFLRLVQDDFAVLRHFRGQSSLATYLTVVARRIVVRSMFDRKPTMPAAENVSVSSAHSSAPLKPHAEQRLDDQEHVQRLLEGLDSRDAQVVRMFHLEGMSYEEISRATGLAENSIGPVLSRARDKMRRAADGATR